jgi:hypothetical protein
MFENLSDSDSLDMDSEEKEPGSCAMSTAK